MTLSITRTVRGAFLGATLALGAVVALPAADALAGPQYIDSSGYAVSGYDVVAYFDLDQSAIGSAQASGVKGSKEFTAEHNGATWAFSSAENRDKFVADPAKYAPAYDGHCAYGVAQGGKVPANPNLWRIVDGTLYLNVNKAVVGFWEKDIPGNITKSEGNWPGIESKGASSKPIPAFTSEAPTG